MEASAFFTHLWNDYVALAPQAAKIKALFEARGETVLNDHVAFRSYDLGPLTIEHLEKPLLAIGYERYEPYRFEAKKLDAFGYVHADPQLPRVFLSQLETASLSAGARAIVQKLVDQVDPARVAQEDILWAGRLWEPLSHADYLTLREESEYAAWVAALGLRPNHFTIAVNHLLQTPSIEDTLDVVEAAGYPINESGGRVKGTPQVLLQQGSTMADLMPVEFADGETHQIPTCYYEFALRYPDADVKLYQGFVAASADKIFESTDAKGR